MVYNKYRMKNYILGIATVLVIALLLLLAYQYTKQNTPKENLPERPTITQSQKTTVPTLIVTPTIKKESDNELIKKALFSKNKWPDDGTITVTVSTNDGKYASGTATSQGGGGYFFAIKIGDKWEIVADGNGVISCSSLVKYPDFPLNLIPECWDDKTQKSVKR